MTKTKKNSIIGKFQEHQDDTGSTRVQVAILTERINLLSEHLKANKKDVHSRRGLIGMVSKRRRLLTYIKRQDTTAYENLIQELSIRK